MKRGFRLRAKIPKNQTSFTQTAVSNLDLTLILYENNNTFLVAIILLNTSCQSNGQTSETPCEAATVFDKVAATEIIEKRSREFEEAFDNLLRTYLTIKA